MIKVSIVSIVVFLPLIVLLGTVAYTSYICVKYIKENKR